MKKLLLFTLLASLFYIAPAQQVKWLTIEKASTTHNERLYMIDFYTSWCGWCKKMDSETFSDPTVQKILNNYYNPVKFNAEGNSEFTWNNIKFTNTPTPPGSRPATHMFAKTILGQKMGFPSFGIFNENQTLITVVQGYNNAKEFAMILWYFASGDYKKYPYEKYQTIFDEDIRPTMLQKLK